MEGLERVWGTGTKGLEGTKTQGEGGKRMKRLWNATHENTGAAGKGEARGGEIVAVAEWKPGRGVERSVSLAPSPRSLAWSRRRRSWPLRRRNGSKDLRPSSSRHSIAPSPPLERATCPSDQRAPPLTIDPKSVGTSVDSPT